MARKAKLGSTNGFDPDQIKNFVAKIEDLNEQIASEMGAAMNRCKGFKNSIKTVLAEAKALGIPPAEVRDVVTMRALKAKQNKILDSKEPEARETFDAIVSAIGEDFAGLPLGVAALERAASPAEKSAIARLVK